MGAGHSVLQELGAENDALVTEVIGRKNMAKPETKPFLPEMSLIALCWLTTSYNFHSRGSNTFWLL